MVLRQISCIHFKPVAMIFRVQGPQWKDECSWFKIKLYDFLFILYNNAPQNISNPVEKFWWRRACFDFAQSDRVVRHLKKHLYALLLLKIPCFSEAANTLKEEIKEKFEGKNYETLWGRKNCLNVIFVCVRIFKQVALSKACPVLEF